MVDYLNTFTQFGAHLRVLRKTSALFEHTHLSSNPLFSKRLIDDAYDNSVDEEEIAETLTNNALEVSNVGSLRSLHSSQQTTFEEAFFPVLDKEILTSQTDIDAGTIDYVYDVLASGEIKLSERTGRLGALRRTMLTDGETILKNAVVLGALAVAPGPNVGVLTLSVSTGEDHTLAGDIILEVTSPTVGLTQLSVELKLATGLIDDTIIIPADNPITLGVPYFDGETGVTLQLDLPGLTAPVETGDDGAMFSATTITSPAAGDTDNGKIFIRVTRQVANGIWLIEMFSDGSLTTLVGSTSESGIVGTVGVSITGSSGTVWASTFDRAAANVHLPVAPNADADITYDIQNPRIGDRWQIPVTNDEAGNFATKIAKRYRASLNSVAAGNTISDALAASISMT